MRHDWVLWVLVTASALHVVEEHALGWQGWAGGVLVLQKRFRYADVDPATAMPTAGSPDTST